MFHIYECAMITDEVQECMTQDLQSTTNSILEDIKDFFLHMLTRMVETQE